MFIFLGIVGELATIIGSVIIIFNAGLNSVLEIAKNGYKIDKNELDEFQKKETENNKEKTNLAKRILNTILFFTPGINLIIATIKGIKQNKDFMNDPQIKEIIVPMTEEEKEQFAKMEGKFQKLAFTAFTATKEKDQELIGFAGKRLIAVDHEASSLYYEPLISLDYTLDEVKRLNEATTFSYRIGKMDGKNVAIIGIPNPDSPISRIDLKSENYKITHSYEIMTEEEAKDKTFIVYPYMSETNEKVQKVVDEIKQSRIKDAAYTNTETSQVEPTFNQEIIPTETEQILSEEQQGPKLVKTMHPQNEKK